jgi:hypothetical protein
MGPVWLSLRAELRLRWRALTGLAVLLGLIGGVALTAAAGARRTEPTPAYFRRHGPNPAQRVTGAGLRA